MLPIAEFLDVAPVVGEDELVDRVAAAALDEFAERGIAAPLWKMSLAVPASRG